MPIMSHASLLINDLIVDNLFSGMSTCTALQTQNPRVLMQVERIANVPLTFGSGCQWNVGEPLEDVMAEIIECSPRKLGLRIRLRNDETW